jgi:AraC family transcriptional regulator
MRDIEQRSLPSGPFYGDATFRREVGGVVFVESVYCHERHIPKHEHANAFFNLVLEGTYTESCHGVIRTRGPLTLALHPSGEAHADWWHGRGGRVFHVEIWASRLQQIREYSSVLDTPAEFRTGAPIWLASRLYREYLRNDAVSALAMEGLMLEILAECSCDRQISPGRKPPSWLQPVRELIHDRFVESLTHEAVAATAGVHPVHLARVFRKHYGCTVGDYVRRLRVDFVSEQLISTDVPLAELASAAGFADQSHLNRTFKRSTGMTPGNFRKVRRSR